MPNFLRVQRHWGFHEICSRTDSEKGSAPIVKHKQPWTHSTLVPNTADMGSGVGQMSPNLKTKGGGGSFRLYIDLILNGIDSAQQERKRVGGNSSSLQLDWIDPCRTVLCQYYDWGMPGLRAWPTVAVYEYSICSSTMPRAQNRAGKGSILLWRRLTFPIFLLFIYELDLHGTASQNLIVYLD